MKKISIVTGCYNEEENIVPLSEEIVKIFETVLVSYDYEIIIIDNCSTDNTRPLIREICRKNHRIKAIFNTRNFGPNVAGHYGLYHTSGDCVIVIASDFQDPPELIPLFVCEWEKGYKVVASIKKKSKENFFIHFLRTSYYKILKIMSDVEQIEHFTGFGLYDKSFVEVYRNLRDPTPSLRGIVAEMGFRRKDIYFEKPKRRAGKSKYNFFMLYDFAMLNFTAYTKNGLRLATISGFLIGCITLLIALGYLIMKLLYWDSFYAGLAPLVIGVFFLGSIQLFFLGFIGEYILSINTRLMNRPYLIEEERINFDEIE